MHKFATKFSMVCDKNQYEKDLKDKLISLGYNLAHEGDKNILVAGFRNVNNSLAFIGSDLGVKRKLHFTSYNPELFLALAAMTEGKDWIVGEYLTDISGQSSNGLIFKCLYLLGCNSRSGHAHNKCNGKYYRKATVEELINHFTNKSCIKSIPANNLTSNKVDELNYKVGDWVFMEWAGHRAYDKCRRPVQISDINNNNTLINYRHNDRSYAISLNQISNTYAIKKISRKAKPHEIKFDKGYKDVITNKVVNQDYYINLHNNSNNINNGSKNKSTDSKSIDDSINGGSRQDRVIPTFGRRGEGFKPSYRRRGKAAPKFGETRRRSGEGIRIESKPSTTTRLQW